MGARMVGIGRAWAGPDGLGKDVRLRAARAHPAGAEPYAAHGGPAERVDPRADP